MEIKETLLLSHCWICHNKNALEEHHVIPRHCGGEKGPTVTLCGVCHYSIHKINIGKHVSFGEVYLRELCSLWVYPNHQAQALYLASVILKADKLSKDSCNRSIKFMTTLDTHTHYMLRSCAKGLGLTQAQVVEKAIHLIYTKFIR